MFVFILGFSIISFKILYLLFYVFKVVWFAPVNFRVLHQSYPLNISKYTSAVKLSFIAVLLNMFEFTDIVAKYVQTLLNKTY